MTTLNALWISTWMFAASPTMAAPAPAPTVAPVVEVLPGPSLYLADSVSESTVEDLGTRLRRLAADEESLGENRRRRLRVARSYLPRWDLGAVWHDDPRIEEEIEEAVGHCVLKLIRVRTEEHLGLTDLRKRRDLRRDARQETATGRRWSVSPRAGVGHDPWLGSKLRWRHRGERTNWRHGDLALGLKQHLLHDELAVSLEWQNDDLRLGVEHIWDSEESGDLYHMTLRWRF